MADKAKDNLLVKFTEFFFKRWRFTLLFWIFLLGVGGAVYTNIIKREGFPPIQFPISFVNGTYFVDNKDKVDSDLAIPLYELFSSVDGVKDVSTTAGDNFFTAVVEFEEDVSSVAGTASLNQAIESATTLPQQADINVISLDPAGFLNQYDMLLSVYSTEPTTTDELQRVADYVAQNFANDPQIVEAEVQPLLETAVNPSTGVEETRQTKFSQIGLPENGNINYHQSITVGVDRDKEQIDIIELSELATERIENLDLKVFGDNYQVAIGADFSESINTQISSLQSNLFTGLIAVALVSFLLITWRASIITGLFMITVMLVTVTILYLVGYTLNTITLFALVLSLGLFVDDATIVVESIDANRKKKKKALTVIKEAIAKIGAASFAGTFTTVLVFLPLAFLTGILGEFIRLMPITIIIALITSLVLSLTVIPLLSKFILLKHEKDSWITRNNPISRLESYLANIAGAMPRLLKLKPRKGKAVAAGMILLSLAFVVVAFSFASKLSFNIFPPAKDSDQIGYEITYPTGYTLDQAETVANDINALVQSEIGTNVVRVTYGRSQQPNARSADVLVELVPFSDREEKSPYLIDKLQNAIDEAIPKDVSVVVTQFDSGPPVSEFPLQIQIKEEDIQKATKLATEVEEYIANATIKRANGTSAHVIETRPPSPQSVTRVSGERTLQVLGAFDADDVSGLLTAAEEYVREKFTPEYLEQNGYSKDTLGFDFGQESDNAESFASLAWAFPLALLLMYVLLATQFRSFLQPLLIFMAIPFTFLGVFAGLYFTDNALSFFVQVGLIGLIGIAVNNTILLTEYANQEKRAGVGSIDAISNAVTKRFRPLVTTTLTTVVALLPLALSDPFWEALAYTIIFGLASSTILVVLSFPYYYLATEWLRNHTSRRFRRARKARKQALIKS